MSVAPDFNTELIKCLLAADTASQFLQEALSVLKAFKPKMGFADLSRKMGFSSRSFVRLLFLGKRKPNLKNYRQIAQGLGLSKEATRYFSLLLEKEQSKFQSRLALDSELIQSKEKLCKFLQRKSNRMESTSFLPYEKWPYIYASLGSLEKGHTLDEIKNLSGETRESCLDILQVLLSKGLSIYDEKSQCYRPTENMLEIGELGQSIIFKKLYRTNTLRNLSRLDREFNNPQAVFYTSVFSVKKKDLAKLTKSLQEVLAAYASEAEDGEGDELAILSSALLPLN